MQRSDVNQTPQVVVSSDVNVNIKIIYDENKIINKEVNICTNPITTNEK